MGSEPEGKRVIKDEYNRRKTKDWTPESEKRRCERRDGSGTAKAAGSRKKRSFLVGRKDKV
jgi:hypothetical protein